MVLGDGSTIMAPDQQRAVFHRVRQVRTGAFRWGKSTGTDRRGSYARQTMTVDPSSQSIIAVGFYDGTLDFGGGPLAASVSSTHFTAKIGWDGSFISSAHFGGPLIDAFFDVAVSPTGDLFVSGAHQGPRRFWRRNPRDTPRPRRPSSAAHTSSSVRGCSSGCCALRIVGRTCSAYDVRFRSPP
jgi:hypothetical protein